MNLIFLLLIILNIVPNNYTYENHYIPESNEFEKNNLFKSISINKRQFYPKYQLNNILNKKYFHDKVNLEKITSVKKKYDFQVNKISEIDKTNNYTKIREEILSKADKNKTVNEINRHPENLQQNVFSSQPTNIPTDFEKSPIYFTNPTTGVVYAITEIGYNYTKPTNSISGSIPIYIPKEQYDRDMNLLKLSFMRQCKSLKKKDHKNKQSFFNKKKQNKTKIDTQNYNPVILNNLHELKKKQLPNKNLRKKTRKNIKTKKTEKIDESDEYKDPLKSIQDMFYEMVGVSSEEIHAKPQNTKLIKINKIVPTVDTNNNESYTIKKNMVLDTQVENPKGFLEFPPTTMRILTNIPLKKPKFNKTANIKILNPAHESSASSINAKPIPIKFFNSIGNNNLSFQEYKTNISPKNKEISTPIFLDKTYSKENTKFVRMSSLKFVVRNGLNKSLSAPVIGDYKKLSSILNRSKRSPEMFQNSEEIKALYNTKNSKELPLNFIIRSKSYISAPLDYVKENKNISMTKKFLNRVHSINKTGDSTILNESKESVITTLPIKIYNKSPSAQLQFAGYNDDNDITNGHDNELAYDDSSSDPDDDYFISFEDFYFNEPNDEDSDEIEHKIRKNVPKKGKAKKNQIKYKNDNYDDNDDDDFDSPSITEMIKAFIYPFQKVLEKVGVPIIGNIHVGNSKIRKPKFPKYTTLYDKFEDNESGSSSWFNWFGFGDYSKDDKPPVKEPGWFDSWFDNNDERQTTPSTASEEHDENWFPNWFESKSKKPTAETTPIPTEVPILTIANPMKNPQKWIGILAQHIVNSTSTINPLLHDYEPKTKSYDKYQMWRLKPFGENQVKVLEKYKYSEEGGKLEWLCGPTLRGLTDVLIPPKLLTDFQGTLNYEDIAHEVIIFNVGKAIQFETSQRNATRNNLMSVNRYKDYDEIIRYIENMQLKYPNFVELFHIGRSYEGRPLVIVKVATKNEEKKKLKFKDKIKNESSGVFIEGGVYGREWITAASAIWIINEIVKIMKNNKTNANTEFIKNTNWYIMPVLNPDGYQYSHDFDRFWQKSRSKNMYKPGIFTSAIDWIQQTTSEKLCFGVDLDQNWEYDWGKSLSGSNFPCSQFFIGSNAFSEPETKALSKFLMDYRKKIKLHISLQSYGHIITYPTKVNKTLNAQRTEDLLDVAMVGNDALRKSGSDFRFKLDSSNDLVVSKSGSSNYYALYEVGIPFAYTLYLGDNGVHGYLLPASHIDTAARTTFEVIKGMIDYI